MLTISNTTTTVTAGDPTPWATSVNSVATCTGAVCTPAMNADTTTDTAGTLTVPDDIQLFNLNDTDYILQTVDSLVLERQ